MADSPADETPADELDFGLGQLGEIDDEQGLSLEELSQAYADLIEGGGDPYTANSSDKGESTAATEPWEVDSDDADDSCDVSPHSILEAMLFVGHPANEPLTSRVVAGLMRGVRPSEIDEMIRDLNHSYAEQRCPFEIRSVGAGYRLELKPEFSLLRDRFYGRIKAAKLTQQVVDVLAIVAYKQPISKGEVDSIRGKPSAGVLAQLVRRQLLKLVREPASDAEPPTISSAKLQSAKSKKPQSKKPQSKKPKPPKLVPMYYTTDRFLQVFGLVALGDLPRSEDIDRLW